MFLVDHLHTLPNGEECVKRIGVYADRRSAEDAVHRLSSQPGFCNLPEIIDFTVPGQVGGFYIEEYEIGKDHWTEGFVTLVGDKDYEPEESEDA